MQDNLKEKDAQIKAKDETISEFGLKFAKLADQAQKLNLADKPNLIESKKAAASNKKKVKETVEKLSKSKKWWHFWK